MQFVSFYFILFILISVLLYQVVPVKMRLVLLLFSNILFYVSYGIKNFIILFTMSILSYLFHRILQQKKNKVLLWVSLLLTLLPLLTSKYVTGIGSFFATIGISFFTFKMISFLVETYRGNLPLEVSFFHYAIYISFFPTITAGPIDRPTEFLSQIKEKNNFHTISTSDLYGSFLMILFGYFEKVLIADRLAQIVQYVYSDYERYGGMFLFVITLLYTLQIYFDFAGYSYITKGLARAYGFQSMENFNVPYFSKSIQEFWKRWHISLSSWLRDYVYIPLGGNREGTFRKYVNIMITFAVSGLWHGTGLAFLVWGLLHGSFQVIGSICKSVKEKLLSVIHIPKMFQSLFETMVTFLLVDFAWIFFAAPKGIKSALSIIQRIFIPTEVWIGPFLQNVSLTKLSILVLLTAFFFCLIVDIMHYTQIDVIAWFLRRNAVFKACVLYYMIFGILVFGVYGPGFDASAFIYFAF